MRPHWHIVMGDDLAGVFDATAKDTAADLALLAAGLPSIMRLVAHPRCEDQHVDGGTEPAIPSDPADPGMVRDQILGIVHDIFATGEQEYDAKITPQHRVKSDARDQRWVDQIIATRLAPWDGS